MALTESPSVSRPRGLIAVAWARLRSEGSIRLGSFSARDRLQNRRHRPPVSDSIISIWIVISLLFLLNLHLKLRGAYGSLIHP